MFYIYHYCRSCEKVINEFTQEKPIVNYGLNTGQPLIKINGYCQYCNNPEVFAEQRTTPLINYSPADDNTPTLSIPENNYWFKQKYGKKKSSNKAKMEAFKFEDNWIIVLF